MRLTFEERAELRAELLFQHGLTGYEVAHAGVEVGAAHKEGRRRKVEGRKGGNR